jgi:hypothetical protein
MGREKLKQENGRKALEAMKDGAIKKGAAMNADDFFWACPWKCPWKIREFIEKEEDPNFLLQDLVKVGEPKVKTENFIKAINKAVQDLELPHEPLPTEAQKEGKRKNAEPSLGKIQEEEEEREVKEEQGRTGKYLSSQKV